LSAGNYQAVVIIHSERFLQSIVALITLAACGVNHADQIVPVRAQLIEVFISADTNITGVREIKQQQENVGLEIKIYRLDGIQQIESELSRDLARDPELAKSAVTERIQKLNAGARAEMQNAATGMAKAMQYGIDRLPAMVIDSQAVVYGITGLPEALGHYMAWRAGSRP
jgi:integrating conjugative element protein (TIGR03757 family)